VILEDNESDTPEPEPEATAVSASVDAGADPVFDPSKPVHPSSHEAWWDVEDGCFVDEDLHPLPPLEQEGLAPTLAQDQPCSCRYSPGSSHDQTSPYDNGTTGSASEEPARQSLPTLLEKDSRGGSRGSASDFEKDLQLAFEEQESSSATSPSSLHPRRSAEPSYLQIDQGHDQSRLEELGSNSWLRRQEQDKEGPRGQQEQQEGRDDDDGNDNREREQQGGKRQHQVAGISTGHSHDTDDEGDENPRPAKRGRPSPVSPSVLPTPPFERSSKPCLRQPHSLTLPSTTQPEIDESPSQADHGHLSTQIDDGHYYTPPPTSRSPSVVAESAPVAEYQEWPFQGFLKRVTIGNQTTYNLEFSLPRIPEHLNLSLHSEDLSDSSEESSIEATVSRRAVTSRKPSKELTKDQESLLAKMVHDDQTWTEIGQHFPGHTLQSLKENFFTKQGGKPRKRGRKPGVRRGVREWEGN
jgi:hypothetical protein